MVNTKRFFRALLTNIYFDNTLVFILCAAASYLTASSYLDKNVGIGELFYLILGLSFALVLLSSYFAQNLQGLSIPVLIFLTTVLILSLANHLICKRSFSNYGDYVHIIGLIKNGAVFSRWLVGTVILNTVYEAVWKYPPFIAFLETITFLKFVSTIFVGITSLLIVKKYGKKFSVVLAITNALWFLFLVGYYEYYPFIVPVYLLALIFIFDDDIINDTKKAQLLCAFYTTLPLVYIGFAPISIFALVYLFIKYKNQFIKLILTSFIVFFAVLNFTWGNNYASFFKQLYIDMNFSQGPVSPDPVGKIISNPSIYFKRDYALSGEHLNNLFYMGFFGGGITGLLLLTLTMCTTIFVLINKRVFPFAWNWGKAVLLIAIVLQQLHYFIFFVPLLGPRADIDLFVFVYITFSYFAGYIIDRLIVYQPTNKQMVVKSFVLSAVLGYQAIVFFMLAVVGIPNPPL